MKSYSLHTLLCFAAAMVICGCGGGVDKEPTYSVTGKVTMDGAPVDGATVTFIRDGGGKPAVGITDASGSYKLTTYAKDDGAIPGEYKVTIAKYEAAAEQASAGGTTTADGEDVYPEDYDPNAGSEQGSSNLLPEKFANFATSGFAFTVRAETNTADWDLSEGGGSLPTE